MDKKGTEFERKVLIETPSNELKNLDIQSKRKNFWWNLETWKFIVEILIFVVTASMAVTTYLAVRETRELKEVDIGPNISLADAIITIFDTTDTAVKKTSWVDGEKINTSSINVETSEIDLSLKFLNTGKEAGYIKIVDATSTGSQFYLTTHNTYLVPAQGQTGEIFWSNLLNLKLVSPKSKKNQFIKIKYELAVLDMYRKEKKRIIILIGCYMEYKEKYTSYEMGCMPIAE